MKWNDLQDQFKMGAWLSVRNHLQWSVILVTTPDSITANYCVITGNDTQSLKKAACSRYTLIRPNVYVMQHGQNAQINYCNESQADANRSTCLPNFNLLRLLQFNGIYSCPHLVYITLYLFKTRHICTKSSFDFLPLEKIKN